LLIGAACRTMVNVAFVPPSSTTTLSGASITTPATGVSEGKGVGFRVGAIVGGNDIVGVEVGNAEGAGTGTTLGNGVGDLLAVGPGVGAGEGAGEGAMLTVGEKVG